MVHRVQGAANRRMCPIILILPQPFIIFHDKSGTFSWGGGWGHVNGGRGVFQPQSSGLV